MDRNRLLDRRNPQDVMSAMTPSEMLMEAKALAWKLVKAAEEFEKAGGINGIGKNKFVIGRTKFVLIKGRIDSIFRDYVSGPYTRECREAENGASPPSNPLDLATEDVRQHIIAAANAPPNQKAPAMQGRQNTIEKTGSESDWRPRTSTRSRRPKLKKRKLAATDTLDKGPETTGMDQEKNNPTADDYILLLEHPGSECRKSLTRYSLEPLRVKMLKVDLLKESELMKVILAKGPTARTTGGDRVFVPKQHALPGFEINHDVIYVSRLLDSDAISHQNGYLKASASGMLIQYGRGWAAVKRWADWINSGKGNYSLDGAELQDFLDVINIVKIFGGPKDSLEPVREGIRILRDAEESS